MSKTYRHKILFKLRFDRILSRSLGWQLLLLFLAMAVALFFSYLFLSWSGAEWKEFCQNKNLEQWLLPIYLFIDSNALNNLYIQPDGQVVHGWMLFASSFTFILGTVLFSGFIIGIITTTIERRVSNYKEGNTFYLKSGHYIIMGYDEMATSVISHLLKSDPGTYILLLTSADADKIREKLLKSFTAKEMKKIIINYGHRVSTDIFDDIRLDKAKEVFVVGNHSKPAHDAINVESVDAICRFLSRPDVDSKPSRITCMFKDIDTYAAFKTSDIFRKVEKLGIEFVPYNIQTGWATQIFVNRLYRDFDNAGKTYPYPRMYRHGITENDERYVHLVFVGTTNFAVAFAMEAANVLHFPNGSRRKTLITFIDRNMDREKDEFITRNRHFFEVQPYLWRDLSSVTPDPVPREMREYLRFDGEDAGFLDVQFEFIKGDIFSKNVQDELQNLARRNNREEYLTIFLALADQRENFVIGMNMPDEVYDNGVNIFMRQDRSDNFVTDLRTVDTKNEKEKLPYRAMGEDGECHTELRDARYANLYPFGMNETAYFIDDTSLNQAKLINFLYETADYENHKFLDDKQLAAIPESKIWADADAYWSDLTVAKKWSNLYNAYTIPTKLDVLRTMRGLALDDDSTDLRPLSDEEVKVLARLEHDRWNVEKLLMGFRKPMPCEDKYRHPEVAAMRKNKDLFIHHDLRPFEKLDTVAELDREFSRAIPWVLKMTVNRNSRDESEADVNESYMPRPLDTSDVELDPELGPLMEQLAADVHETWALGRYKEGWRFGRKRDYAGKRTPCMVPYDSLPEKEKNYDRATSTQTLKFILKKGFKISK